MSRQPGKTHLPKHLRLPTLLLIIAIITLLLSIGVRSLLLLQNNTSDHSQTSSPSPIITGGTQINTNNPGDLPTNNGSVSPLLFGTNLSLFDGNDQVLTSASTRSQLQQMHFR